MDIAQQAQQQPAQRVAVATADTIHTHTTLILTRPPIRQEATQLVEAVDLLEPQNHAGHEQVLVSFYQRHYQYFLIFHLLN